MAVPAWLRICALVKFTISAAMSVSRMRDSDAERFSTVTERFESVPPQAYGGTERVVSYLAEALVEMGHDVTLYASGDSVTRAKLHSVWPRALRLGRPRSDPIAAQTVLLEAMSQRAAEFDVIHAHIDWLHLPLLSRLGVPFVTTLHGRLDLPGLPEVVRRFPDAPFVSISNNQRAALGDANWLGTVHHGLPANMFRPSFEDGWRVQRVVAAAETAAHTGTWVAVEREDGR